MVASKEAIIHLQVCNYLRYQYPGVLFRTDFAAGTKMTMGQAIKHKKLQAVRAWPDLFIAEPRQGFGGLFIELKAYSPYKQDGTLFSNDHLKEQAAVLARLAERKFVAAFAVGFEQAKQIIDDYLGVA